MADIKITALPEDTAPTIDDLVILVNDPGGAEVTRMATIENLWKPLEALSWNSSPWVDVRYFMDGLAGRPTYATWYANQTTTDVTDVIQEAIDADTGPVFFPEGIYCYTALVLNSGTKLIGSGWASSASYVFANAGWLTMSNHKGTILQCTSDAADSITFDVVATIFGVKIKDMLILGPGSGASVGINASVVLGIGRNYGFLDNVLVANFATGITFGFFITNSIHNLIVRGCTTGIVWGDTAICTDNKVYNLEVELCTTAIKLEWCIRLGVFGGLIQTNTTGIDFAPSAAGYVTSNTFYDVWFEGNTDAWILTNGANGLTNTRFESCRSSEAFTWTIGAADSVNQFTIESCYFYVTIDFSADPVVYGFTINNTGLEDLVGIPNVNTYFFSGKCVSIYTPAIVCDFQGKGNKVTYGTAAPVAGTWSVGDVCWNTAPASLGAPGWVCTTAPGTWKAMASLA